ncbi:unnamed protein product [Sordaria macrospora k-hell]|uniref:WGS project CABT00000000 data, contig 2.5 n=1 Tax=Sordaria macrospora (strain ATCC MYA-333 / DSM 997 / K(L3346) / K-hell) TaxID=771870 RepID=F7VRZ7_SORMK|nr:uncharacterized protein SMAC_01831 [Sordaria macrospora k-hell]CCC08283.1 unnamed protein product [Sordaria macrospora k-hell]
MLHHIAAVGGSLAKRYIEVVEVNDPNSNPGGSRPPASGDEAVIALLPLAVYYTAHTVFPTLAMIEDPNPPPGYTPVPLDTQEDSAPSGEFEVVEANPKPITSSLHATHRLLWTWRREGYFQGLGCALITVFCTVVLAAFITVYTFLPHFVGSFIATVLLTQLSTVWVHIVITPPSARPWYSRILPFRYVFKATALPLLAHWAASVAAIEIPRLLAFILGLPVNLDQNSDSNSDSPSDPNMDLPLSMLLLKGIPVAALTILLYLFAVIPTQVILVRVQASLLPPTEDAIVPFDRSFKGKLDPAVLGGGSETFLTMRDALTTFGREGWSRLVKMYLKVFGVTVAFHMVVMATFALESGIIYSIYWLTTPRQ